MRAPLLYLQNKVRAQDSWTVIYSVSRANPRARELVWKFVQEKWATLKDRYKGQFLLARIIDVSHITLWC